MGIFIFGSGVESRKIRNEVEKFEDYSKQENPGRNTHSGDPPRPLIMWKISLGKERGKGRRREVQGGAWDKKILH